MGVSGEEVDGTALGSRIGDASNVLLLVPALDEHDEDACIDLLTLADPAGENVLSVTYTQSADDRMDRWRSRVGDPPARTGIVDVGDTTRSAAAGGGSSDLLGSVSVETVPSPGDLTALGIRLSTYLGEWRDDPNQTVMCFRSLTALLQYADLQRVFRFLHVLTGQVEAAGAVAHYHIDPTAHDEKTVNTLKTLFDATVELRDDGEWVVRRR